MSQGKGERWSRLYTANLLRDHKSLKKEQQGGSLSYRSLSYRSLTFQTRRRVYALKSLSVFFFVW